MYHFILHTTFWVFGPHCLDYMTPPISSHSWDNSFFLMLVCFTLENRYFEWECCLHKDVVGANSKYFATNRERQETLNSLHVFNFYCDTRLVLNSVNSLISYSWWCYHLMVKGNCSVFCLILHLGLLLSSIGQNFFLTPHIPKEFIQGFSAGSAGQLISPAPQLCWHWLMTPV